MQIPSLPGVLQFGKFKGWRIEEVPAYYLADYIRRAQDTIREFEEELGRRVQELRREGR